MSRTVRVCGGCGAKNSPGWRRCQRCRSELTAAPVEADATEPRRLPWRLVAAAAGLAAVGALAWPTDRPAPVPATGRSPAGARQPAGSPGPAAAGTGEGREPARTPVTRDDFARAGEAAYAQGQLDVALSAFEGAVAGFPDDGDARNNLGQLLVRLDRVPEALPHLEAAVAADAGKWAYRFNLARARGQGGDWNGAAADYRVAADLFPDDHVTLFNLGKALQRTGDDAGAAVALERAVALAPSEPAFLLSLAASYEKLSRLPEAVQAYRRFLERDPAARDAPAIRSRIARLEQVGAPDREAQATAAPPPGA